MEAQGATEEHLLRQEAISMEMNQQLTSIDLKFDKSM